MVSSDMKSFKPTAKEYNPLESLAFWERWHAKRDEEGAADEQLLALRKTAGKQRSYALLVQMRWRVTARREDCFSLNVNGKNERL